MMRQGTMERLPGENCKAKRLIYRSLVTGDVVMRVTNQQIKTPLKQSKRKTRTKYRFWSLDYP